MPDRPTADECAAVHRALVDCHGKPPAPQNMQFEDDEEGGPVTDNGKVSSVLDSVFRCMLTLNTNARVRGSCSARLCGICH